MQITCMQTKVCKGEHPDMYVQSNTLLLAAVSESFKNIF